jgi:hypothetical protein
MKTASFKTYSGPGRISIARYAPRGTPAGYRVFKALAPDQDMLHLVREAYLPRYQAILDRLDPQATWDHLHALAGDAEPILLCWEVPPFSARNWCHRRLVADWFQARLGASVPEFQSNLMLGL